MLVLALRQCVPLLLVLKGDFVFAIVLRSLVLLSRGVVIRDPCWLVIRCFTLVFNILTKIIAHREVLLEFEGDSLFNAACPLVN